MSIIATTRKRKVEEIAQQPKAGMTVQEYLLEEKTKMLDAIQDHVRGQVNTFRNEFELIKIELENEVERKIAELEKQDEQQSEESSAKKSKTNSNNNNNKIKIVVVEGVHKNASFNFKRTQRLTVMIGRSTGKRFKNTGVSLYKDSEVSTTHGKIHVIKNDLCFSDLGSTNGSFLNGQALEARKSYVVYDGDVLKLGQSHLNISIE